MRCTYTVVVAACALVGVSAAMHYRADRKPYIIGAPPVPNLGERASNPNSDQVQKERARDRNADIHRLIIEPRSMFGVDVLLEDAPKPGEKKLAEEAKRQLLLNKPENPGRSKSFPKWQTVKQPGKEPTPLTRIGWFALIRRVEPLPGGWRARVYIFPKVTTQDRRVFSPRNFHIEVYSFKDGELTLESDSIGPDALTAPDAGISGYYFG